MYLGVTNLEIHDGTYYRIPVSIFDIKALQNNYKTMKKEYIK